MDIDKLRELAKQRGISSWHVKSEETLRKELDVIDNPQEKHVEDNSLPVLAYAHNGYRMWLSANEAERQLQLGAIVKYEKA